MKFYSDLEGTKLEGVIDFDFLTIRVDFDFQTLTFTIRVLFSNNVFFTFRVESEERLT